MALGPLFPAPPAVPADGFTANERHLLGVIRSLQAELIACRTELDQREELLRHGREHLEDVRRLMLAFVREDADEAPPDGAPDATPE